MLGSDDDHEPSLFDEACEDFFGGVPVGFRKQELELADGKEVRVEKLPKSWPLASVMIPFWGAGGPTREAHGRRSHANFSHVVVPIHLR